ncbi:MAG: phenylalanine--tRNA ligase subunit beta [Clostridia bacterium]|nr:phenylalanine--tRNA ligase subunit beta [Clostridia bacterium]
MNLSRNWLNQFVDVRDIEDKAYCDAMTDSGSKVEGYEKLGQEISRVVVGKVLSMERHPNSDHMFTCQVQTAPDKTEQIVTGAQNVHPGDFVPAALDGAHLPGGIVIKPSKLRGVDSNGMLCSMAELNLDEHDEPGKEANGILLLDATDADIGTDIHDFLDLTDTVVEFEITSNRPDCLSVIGLARETAVTFDRPWHLPAPVVKGPAGGDPIESYLKVSIAAPDLCSRYAAKVLRNVKIGPSPRWMRRLLCASGVRPINNIVDITNYVMLEYGQPMHAFDYRQIEGKTIQVRRAHNQEAFRSLDDQDHTLDSGMLVIADAKKACALAGVMGGANSEIVADTTTVVFESACFDGISVRKTAQKNGMRTESSSRFEKGLDPENCMPALLRACELAQLLGAGEVVDGTIDVYPGKKDLYRMPFEPEKYNRFLGTDVPVENMLHTLEKLECKVEDGIITVPSFRNDLRCMNDIAEEIIRIWGYNRIESTNIRAETTQGGRTPRQQFTYDLENTLIGLGFSSIQTFTFVSPKIYDRIRLPQDSPLRRSVVISNPLGEDTSIMRTTALPSMLDVLARNSNFNNESACLFEMASVYLPGENADELPEEKTYLTVGAYGKVDFYTLKGVIEQALRANGIRNLTFETAPEHPVFHPGRSALVRSADGTALGTFGQVHPLTASNYNLSAPVFLASLDMDMLYNAAEHKRHYTPLPKYPAVTRDFSFVCDESLEVGKLEEVMARAGGKLTESVSLFDIYRGPQLGENKKSVSLRIVLRAQDHTLTVEEADKVSNKICKDMEFKLGLRIRS